MEAKTTESEDTRYQLETKMYDFIIYRFLCFISGFMIGSLIGAVIAIFSIFIAFDFGVVELLYVELACGIVGLLVGVPVLKLLGVILRIKG